MIDIDGVAVPDSAMAREVTELVRDTAPALLFNHSSRVYYFGALAGQQRGLSFDLELLYAGAMFHDLGLTPQYSSKTDRFEVDGANELQGRHHSGVLQWYQTQAGYDVRQCESRCAGGQEPSVPSRQLLFGDPSVPLERLSAR
jgi:HD superfamily phosphodiesterase